MWTNERPVLPPVADVGGQVGDQVHVADDEAVLGQQVLQHGLVSLGEEEYLPLVTTVRTEASDWSQQLERRPLIGRKKE